VSEILKYIIVYPEIYVHDIPNFAMLIPRSNNTWPDEPAWDPAWDAWGDASWNWEAKGWNKGRPWAPGKRMAEFIKGTPTYGKVMADL